MHDVNANDDAEAELQRRAERETNPRTRARLWGEVIQCVLSLEDIRPGLTFGEIARMPDAEADELADHMRAVFRMERSWQS